MPDVRSCVASRAFLRPHRCHIRLHGGPLPDHPLAQAFPARPAFQQGRAAGLRGLWWAQRESLLSVPSCRPAILEAIADAGNESSSKLARADGPTSVRAWPWPPNSKQTRIRRLAIASPSRIYPRVQSDPGRGLNGRRRVPQGRDRARLPSVPALEVTPQAFRGFGEAWRRQLFRKGSYAPL